MLARAPIIVLAAMLITTSTAAMAGSVDPPSSIPADTRDPTTAFWTSAGATAAAVALIGGGMAARSINEAAGNATVGLGGALLLFGPSAGRDYADDPAPWWPFRLRLAGAGLVVISAFTAEAECADIDPCPGHPKTNIVLGAAAVTIGFGAIWDIATTKASARRYNDRHQTSAMTVRLLPQLSRDGGGFAVAAQF
jgi:hypothetical protein